MTARVVAPLSATLSARMSARLASAALTAASLLLAAGLARAEALLELDVSLDPASRAFKASARLNPAERDFRFLLHESLQVTGASAGGRALTADAQTGPAGLRQWRIRGAVAGVRDQAGRLHPARAVISGASGPETFGRLLPAEEAWARDTAKTPAGLASLTSLLKVRQPIAALASTQTKGQPPAAAAAATDTHGLTADELAVAAACGMTPEAYAKGK